MTSSKKFIPEFKTAWQLLLNKENKKMRIQKQDNTIPETAEDPRIEICKTCNQNHRQVKSFDDVKTSIDHLADLLNQRRNWEIAC